MSVPAVLIKKSTKEIIKHALYPRADMQPVEGLDPDYEWLVKHIPFAEPDYDSRIYIMETQLPDLAFLNDFIEHPSYPGIREYRITYNPVKRTNDLIVISIENAEREANASIWSEATHKDETLFMINSVRKEASGATLNTEEQSPVDKLSVINVKLAKNRDTATIMINQVNNGQEPNIDEGWEN